MKTLNTLTNIRSFGKSGKPVFASLFLPAPTLYLHQKIMAMNSLVDWTRVTSFVMYREALYRSRRHKFVITHMHIGGSSPNLFDLTLPSGSSFMDLSQPARP